MSKRLAYTFRCPEPMREALEQIMDERNLDRTSVIKLALYSFCKLMNREAIRQMDLYQIVDLLEKGEPGSYMTFEEFIEE